jgi:hypothetical protein
MKRVHMRGLRILQCAALLATGLAVNQTASAEVYNDGKVLLTGGVFTVDGAGGGGAVPWATISGYETRDGINGSAAFTYVNLPALQVSFYGVNVGFYDRLELSYVTDRLSLNLPNLQTVALAVGALGLDIGTDPWNSTLQMDTFGAKLRLFGDAVYTSDSWIPQVSVGALWKENKSEDLIHTLGANKNKDYEIYLSATKVFFPISTLVNIGARYTSANETGLTGFGECTGSGATEKCTNDKEVRMEVSIAHLVAKNTAIGGEWQQHGDNLDGKSVRLGGLDAGGIAGLLGTILPGVESALTQKKEGDWFDLFMAYAPNKNISFVVAYLMFSNISVAPDQNGFYFSTHLTF